MVGFCLDTCHAHAGGNALETVVDDVLGITGRIDLVHCNDSRDDFDSGADRHANLGAGRIDPPTCSRRWSATPARRWSARRRAVPPSTSPTSRGCATGSDVFTNSHARRRPRAGMLRSEGLERRRGAFGSLLASSPAIRSSRRPTSSLDAVISVRPVDEREHLAFLAAQPSASFLQTPAWGRVKAEWRRESIGWFARRHDSGRARRWCSTASCPGSSASSPTCPRARSSTGTPTTSALARARWRAPREQGAFAVRIGPPGRHRAGGAPRRSRTGIADPAVHRLGDVPPLERGVDRRAASSPSCTSSAGGEQGAEGGFAAGQPQLQLPGPAGRRDGKPRSEADVLAGMNQLWRRNIKKADKAGRRWSPGAAAAATSRPSTTLYVHTAERDHFTPAAAGLLRDHVRRPRPPRTPTGSGLAGPPRGRPGRGDDRDPGRHARVVLLRRLAPPRSATSAAPTRSSGR